MSNRSILGIAGAAMVGTLAMTNVAHARFEADASGAVTGARTYVMETLTETVMSRTDGRVDGGIFHEVNTNAGNSDLDVRFNVGEGGVAGATLRFRLEFTNLVLAQPVDLTNVDSGNTLRGLRVINPGGTDPTISFDPAPGSTEYTVQLLSGGGAGDRHAEYGVTLGSGLTIPEDHALQFEFQKLGVHPTQPGSVRVVRSRVFAGSPATTTSALSNIIKVVRAYNATGTAATGGLQADAARDFQRFVDGTDDENKTGYLGNIAVSISATSSDDMLYSAQDGTVIAMTEVEKVLRSAEITVAGNVSFLQDDGEDLFLAQSANCEATNKVSLLDDDGDLSGAMTWNWSASGADNITDRTHLCITVDGESAIPVTEPYSVTVDPVGLAGAEFAPTRSSHDLARVTRNGGIWRIAHLTTNRKYNQRIIIQNRGSRAADYSITFSPGEGVTATAGDGASGMLAANSRMVLEARDVVEIEGAGHVSATLEVGALSADIEVATVTTVAAGFESAGATDTVLYEPES